MDSTAVKKIYPKRDELNQVNSLVYCTEKGCTGVFSSKSNLNLHLAKTHKKTHLLQNEEPLREYYCPEVNCMYNSSKHFKTMKTLKQHYLKVHSEKKFVCDTCCKGFPTEAAKNSHMEYCGVMFKCCNCCAAYPVYESLITHGRRKKHSILEKNLYKPAMENALKNICSTKSLQKLDLNGSCSTTCVKPREHFILPRGSVSLQTINSYDKLAFDKSSQTDFNVKTKLKRFLNKDKHSTQETQTLKDMRSQTSTETQTIGDYASRKASDSSLDENRKSIKTQTQQVSSTSKSCNTSFNLNDFEFSSGANIERNSSSTQTTAASAPAELIYSTTADGTDFEFIHTSSQTSFNETMDTFDSDTFLNCNSETQTDLIFENDLLSTDFYTNMCTQTCDEILLHELGFNNTCTQTVLEEMLRSVESQTMMSHSTKTAMTCRDMAHMETQTEIEFKQMLEEINA